MSLDLYAGPLWRFYTRDFETPQQRMAREQGLEHRFIYDGEPIPWPDIATCKASLSGLQADIGANLNIAPADCWNEDCETYHTEQLLDDARAALALVSAYMYRPELRRPDRMPDDIETDPAYSEAPEKGYLVGLIASFEATLWLPCLSEELVFVTDPMEWRFLTTGLTRLESGLATLKREIWNGKTDVDAWLERGAAPGRGWSEKKVINPETGAEEWVTEREEEAENSVLWNAEYGFAVFSKALDFARTHNVPIRTNNVFE